MIQVWTISTSAHQILVCLFHSIGKQMLLMASFNSATLSKLSGSTNQFSSGAADTNAGGALPFSYFIYLLLFISSE